MLCDSEIELDYNVFISFPSQDENQRHIYDKLVEKSVACFGC